jgi:crotonobetainyl-CoA:carnitine CoA-transferase CaiB-like acyl-CoA transferase
MLVELEHATLGPIRLPGVPLKLHATPALARTAPPVLGQHTREVLTGLCGLTDAEVNDLVTQRIVQTWDDQASPPDTAVRDPSRE